MLRPALESESLRNVETHLHRHPGFSTIDKFDWAGPDALTSSVRKSDDYSPYGFTPHMQHMCRLSMTLGSKSQAEGRFLTMKVVGERKLASDTSLALKPALAQPQGWVRSLRADHSIFDCQISSRRFRSLTMRAETSSSKGNGVSNGSSGTTFLRPHLRKLAPYTAIEPFEILSARLGRRPDQIIKLDANENPYGPPPEVRAALSSMPFPHIYPDPETRRLRQALATENCISPEHLLVGCGADELIDLIMRCCLDPGEKIVDCPPTFTMYAFDAAVNNAEVSTVPRLPGFRIDTEGVKKAVSEGGAKIVFLTSPNNPDGSIVAEQDLLEILRLPVLVVLDEAYIEFSVEHSRLRWVEKHSNLIVLRTFSKSAALAGIRVGYGAFPLELITYFWRAKQPYNVSVASETAACAALTNKAYLEECCHALKQERDRMFQELQAISFLEPYPSHSNFVLCNVVGRDAKEVKDVLAHAHGIMVRHYTKQELSGFIRISAGKPEHTDKLLAALKQMDGTEKQLPAKTLSA